MTLPVLSARSRRGTNRKRNPNDPRERERERENREFDFAAPVVIGGGRCREGEGRKETYSVLKPLDFILCTLCRGDDREISLSLSPLPGGRNENEEGGRRGRRKRYHWGFFRVPKDAVI